MNEKVRYWNVPAVLLPASSAESRPDPAHQGLRLKW
jgi:hypothetical protein